MLSWNDTVTNELEALKRKSHYVWLEPILHFHENAPNPFLPPNLSAQFDDPKVKQSRIGRLMIANGLEMDVDLTDPKGSIDNSSIILQNLSTNYFKHTRKGHDSSSSSTPFNIRGSCNFFTQLPENTDAQSFGYLKMFNISMNSCITPFDIIEPILCSAFLFSAGDNRRISHTWNFTFPQSIKYFETAGIDISPAQTASFQIDPAQVELQTFFIIVLSHPMTVENSALMNKYYASPNDSTKLAASKALSQSFPRTKDAFTPFAWTYVDFANLRKSAQPLLTPNAYVLEKPLTESTIMDRIADVIQGKCKQISIQFNLTKSDFSPLIIPPVYAYRPQPFLFPFHQIHLTIKSVSVKSIGSIDPRNILVYISVHPSSKQDAIPAIYSKFNPTKLVTQSFSSAYYHDRNPRFLDDFIIDLPCPTPPSTIILFEIYHVHAKQNEAPMSKVGATSFNVMDKGLIADGDFDIPIIQDGHKDPSSKISIKIDFQSTFDTADPHLKAIRVSRDHFKEHLKGMSDGALVRNLMEILDIWVQMVEDGEPVDLEVLEIIQAAGQRTMKPIRFQKYLIVFTRYFALREYPLKARRSLPENLPLAHSTPKRDSSASELLFDLTSPTPPSKRHNSNKGDYDITDFNSFETVPLIDIDQNRSSNSLATPKFDLINIEPHHHPSMSMSPATFDFSSIGSTGGIPSINSSDALMTSIGEIPAPLSVNIQAPIPRGRSQTMAKKVVNPSGSAVNISQIDPFLSLETPRHRRRLSNRSIEKLAAPADLITIEEDIPTRANKPPIYPRIFAMMKEYIDEKKDLSNISLFVDFLFNLAAKSISCTMMSIMEDRSQIISSFTRVANISAIDGWRPSQSLAVFALILFDLGFADQACEAVCSMLKEMKPAEKTTIELVDFLKIALRPAPLLMFTKHYDEFRTLMCDVVKSAIKSPFLKDIFQIFLKCFSQFESDSAQTVAAGLIKSLVYINMNTLPPITESMPFISYVVFLLANCPPSGLASIDTDPLIKHSHFLLSNVNLKAIQLAYTNKGTSTLKAKDTSRLDRAQTMKRVTRDRNMTLKGKPPPLSNFMTLSPSEKDKAQIALNQMHTAIVHFVEALAQSITKMKCSGPLSIAHHLIVINPTKPFIPVMCGMVTAMISYFVPHILYADSPPMAKFLFDFLRIAESYCSEGVSPSTFATPISTLFQKDFEANGNNHRSMAIAIRTISLFSHTDIVKPYLVAILNCCPNPNEALRGLIERFSLITENSKAITDEKIPLSGKVELLITRLMLFQHSPAAQASVVDLIMNLHKEAKNYGEYLNALTLKAALIAENCTNTWSRVYGIEHPAVLFRDSCTFVDRIVAASEVRDAIVGIPGGNDSIEFSEISFISTLSKAIRFTLDVNLFEYAVTLIDTAWPLLEVFRMYGQVSQLFQMMEQVMSAAADPSRMPDEKAERFFRVKFIGRVFEKNDGVSFVYHANNLVNLFDFSRGVVENYSKIHSDRCIELLSSPQQAINPDSGYIQVTFLNPIGSVQALGRPNRTSLFYFETPFLKDGNGKQQGTVETQWIRRTYLETEFTLPSIVRRSRIVESKTREVEYEPIRVAYRQIREQSVRLERACDQGDFPGIQRLLHGSLLVQVNEGPERTIDAFLESESPRKRKLLREFERFLEANKRGIQKHGEFAADKPEFVQLQVELELHLESLKAKVAELAGKL